MENERRGQHSAESTVEIQLSIPYSYVLAALSDPKACADRRRTPSMHLHPCACSLQKGKSVANDEKENGVNSNTN